MYRNKNGWNSVADTDIHTTNKQTNKNGWHPIKRRRNKNQINDGTTTAVVHTRWRLIINWTFASNERVRKQCMCICCTQTDWLNESSLSNKYCGKSQSVTRFMARLATTPSSFGRDGKKHRKWDGRDKEWTTMNCLYFYWNANVNLRLYVRHLSLCTRTHTHVI